MSSSIQKSNARLAIYTAPVAISFIFALASGGAINIPFVAILSSIQALLGKEGFTVVKEALTLLGAGGVNLLTGEAHERIKTFFKGFQSEKLLNDEKFQEVIKNTIIYILNEEKDKPDFADQKENIERLVKALEKFYAKTIELKTEEINQDIQQAILNSFNYEAKNLTQNASPLNANEWKNLLEDTAIIDSDSFYQEGIGFQLDIPADFKISLDNLAKSLAENFPKRFQNFLEKDLAEGGETFAKFVLDFLKRIDNSGDEIKAILAEFKLEIEKIKQNTSLALQQGQIHQTELREFLDKISLQIDNLQNGLASNGAKPKPQGLINLPREKNDFFVEQSNIFSRLDLELTAHHLAYLHGTHGLGKTTTLVEYAFSRGKDYDFIVYVLATDAAIEAEMARFADEFLENVSAEDTPAQKALKVKVYLEENALWAKESKNWLIIFDNLESAARISQYFPKTAKGDCLYACNEKLFIGNDREVNFEQFSQTEAELFVFQKMNDASEAKREDISAESLAEIKKLVARLGRLPLSLNIATAYLVETKISIGDYVGLLKANVQKFLKYKDTHQASQHGTAFEAFLITLDKVSNFKGEDADGETVGKLAENFLNLLIFCAPEDIPEELIKDTLFQTIDTSATETPHNILFRETVALLKRYGLIREKEKSFKYKEKFAEPKTLADGTKAHWEDKETVISVFDTYRTLQDVLSVKLENEAKKSLLEQMLDVFNGLLPYPELTTWEIYEKYAVHAFPIAEQAEKLAISNESSWWLCNKIGFYFDDIAKYREAEYFYLRGKTIAEDFYGKEHENTATSYNNLATLYYSQGRYEEAEPLYKQALAIRKKLLGENHFFTAQSYGNLAGVYEKQGKYEKAEPLRLSALNIHKEVLGENHTDTATSYNNLAEFYRTQGRYEEAEPLFKQDLAICEKVLGENHPDTAGSYNNLAGLYFNKGNLKLAREYQQKSLNSRSANFGENHPDVAQSYWWLGTFSQKEEKYKEALDYFYKAREIFLRFLSEEHPRVQNLQGWIDYCEQLVGE